MNRRGFLGGLITIPALAVGAKAEAPVAPTVAPVPDFITQSCWRESDIIEAIGIEMDLDFTSLMTAYDRFYRDYGVSPDRLFISTAGAYASCLAISRKFYEETGKKLQCGVDGRLDDYDSWYLASSTNPRLRPIGSVGA